VARVIVTPTLTRLSLAESRLKELRVAPPGDERGAYVWTCQQSPIGVCIYHPPTDPGYYDQCLFCHQPMERK
jgi:hypothetical protein